jgi:putative peptidoglycan lipid II flippase
MARKIGIASLIVMASVFLSRVLGQVRQSYIAYVGGAGSDVDAYTIAFQIPDMLNHVVAGGFLSVTFIPIFARHLVDGNEEEGWRVLSIVLTVCLSVLVVLTVLTVWAAPTLVGWVAPGISDDPETLAKATHMTRIILPAQIFFFAGGIFMAVQYAKGRFLLPALAPLVYNLGIIGGGLALSGPLGIEGFAWGVVMGAFVGQFALQWIGARDAGMRWRPSFRISHPDFRTFLWLTIPLVLGLSMTFSMEFFFKFFGSLLGKGTVASLNYALRVNLMLVAIFGQAAGVASFPFLARLYARGDVPQMLETLNQTIRRYLCLAIPASVLMIVAAPETVVVLFKRGAFDHSAVVTTTAMLRVFLAGAFAMAAVNLVVRGFYATRSTWLPALFGSIAVGLSIPLYWLFTRWLGGLGVALGVTVSGYLQAGILYVVWNRRMGNRGAPTYFALLRALAMTLPLGAALWGLRWLLVQGLDNSRPAGAFLICLLLGTVFLALTIPLARLFRVTEISTLTTRLANKLLRRT